jgi:GT2 family glycosyltransferase
MTSIVMLTQNRYKLMRQSIESLMASDNRQGVHGGTGRSWVLTVVDDGTTDNQAQQFLMSLPKTHCDVRVYRNSDHNLGRLKTSGVIASEARFGRRDWLCLADNDTYFKPGWLERMEQMAEASEPHGFRLWGGQNHPHHRGTPLEFQWGRGAELTSGPSIRMNECETLAGTHMFMRWATWDSCGPMVSDGPGVLRGEDVAFCDRVRAAGGRIGVAAPPVVIDAGITSSNGAPSPGADIKIWTREPGVIYE